MDQMPPLPDFQPEDSQAPRSISPARRQIALTLFSLLFILILSELIGTAVYLILLFAAPEVAALPWIPIAVTSLPSYVVAMPLSLLLFRRIPGAAPEKKKLALPSFLGFFSLMVLLTYAGSLLGTLMNLLIGGIIGEVPTSALDEIAAMTPLWAQILFFVILAPILEEIFYRKLLFDRLRRFGELPAILVCGVLFGLIHGNFYQFFYAAGVGILFSFLYAKTGRIIYTILLHMILNFSGSILVELFSDLFYAESDLLSGVGFILLFVFGLLILLSLAYAIYYWIHNKKALSFEAGEDALPASDFCCALFLNPATIIFLIYTLILFIQSIF